MVIERYLNGCSCGIITVPLANFAGGPEKTTKYFGVYSAPTGFGTKQPLNEHMRDMNVI